MRAVKADLDQARQEIEVPVAAPENDAQEMEEETVEGITDAILERLSANATVRNKVGCVLTIFNDFFFQKLTEQRKQRGRKPPPELTSTSEISKFEVKSNFPALHSASVPGITCLDIHQNVLVTGGKDRNIVIFDKDQQEIIASCKGNYGFHNLLSMLVTDVEAGL